MIFNLNFYVLMASDAFYGFPGPSRSPPQTVCGELAPARINWTKKTNKSRDTSWVSVRHLKDSDKYWDLFQIIITFTGW